MSIDSGRCCKRVFGGMSKLVYPMMNIVCLPNDECCLSSDGRQCCRRVVWSVSRSMCPMSNICLVTMGDAVIEWLSECLSRCMHGFPII